MKLIKRVGLLLFIGGFFIFNATFFMAEYMLNDSILKQHVSQERAELVRDANPELFTSTMGNIAFISQLKKAFLKVNEWAIQDFGITENEIEEMVRISSEKFQLQKAAESLGNEFKVEKLNQYGGWLDGKVYDKKELLKADLSKVANDINEYAVISEKGFDTYFIKDLLFLLTRDAAISPVKDNPVLFLWLTYFVCILGALMYILPKIKSSPPGIKNNGIFTSAMKNRGWLGILTGSYLILFYIILYFYPEYMTQWVEMVNPISQFLKGSDAGRFFLYGFIYTLCILVMGVRMIINYRHSRYQIVRTISVMFFQTSFAFLIPEILLRLNKPYFDFKNIWPLDYDFFFNNELDKLMEGGGLGIFMLGWSIGLIIIGVPVFVYFFGKRWYCSWVCGCGGLAETLGDPYRQLSDKSVKAWKIERWMIHSVLAFAVIMTSTVLYTYFTKEAEIFGVSSYQIREVYGAWIGAGFAGVIGTGFYPLMGNRVWCRFGCPLAAYLGLIQRFKSKFRITTNGGQCISCGNCSTYCEMGIDVRWYAQRGQNIVRSSCVGCGVCSAVCPRGVLKLENGVEKGRMNTEPVLIGLDGAVEDIDLAMNN